MLRIAVLVLLSLLAGTDPHAQEFSYDGNRWYEIEVSVFANTNGPGGNEVFVPEHLTLDYPESLVALAPAQRSFIIDFTEADPATREASGIARGLRDAETGAAGDIRGARAVGADPPGDSGEEITNSALNTLETPYGPVFSPAAGQFRVNDFSKDPFIALSPKAARFIAINRRLETSPEHRPLYHAVWRQPVLSRAQAQAVFIRGGDRFGAHDELEGSLLASFNVNRIDLEVNLWLNTFTVARSRNRNDFSGLVPPQPFPPEDPARDTGGGLFERDYLITEVAQLRETRAMLSNTFHYLDHPAFGVIVQVRPYLLPSDYPALEGADSAD